MLKWVCFVSGRYRGHQNLRNQDKGKMQIPRPNLRYVFSYRAPMHPGNRKDEQKWNWRPGKGSLRQTGRLGEPALEHRAHPREPCWTQQTPSFPTSPGAGTDQSAQSLKARYKLAQGQSACTIGHCHRFPKQGKGQREVLKRPIAFWYCLA